MNHEDIHAKNLRPSHKTFKHAPVVEVTSHELQQKKAARTKRYLQSKVRAPRDGYNTFVSPTTKVLQERQRRIRAREEYKYRKAVRGPTSYNNPRFLPDIDELQRLNMFNRRHKCECHGLRFNKIVKVVRMCNKEAGSNRMCRCQPIIARKEHGEEQYEMQSLMRQVELAHTTFRFLCDREEHEETLCETPDVRGMKCDNCQHYEAYKCKRKDCGCTSIRCDFCKLQFYTYQGISKIVCHCDWRPDHEQFFKLVDRVEAMRPRIDARWSQKKSVYTIMRETRKDFKLSMLRSEVKLDRKDPEVNFLLEHEYPQITTAPQPKKENLAASVSRYTASKRKEKRYWRKLATKDWYVSDESLVSKMSDVSLKESAPWGAEEESAKRPDMEAHGGSFSLPGISVSETLSTGTEALKGILDKIWNKLKAVKDYFVDFAARLCEPDWEKYKNKAAHHWYAAIDKYKSQKKFFQSCGKIIDFFNKFFDFFTDIYNYVVANVGVMPSLVIHLYSILTSPFGPWMFANLAGMLGIFAHCVDKVKYRTYYEYVQDFFHVMHQAAQQMKVDEGDLRSAKKTRQPDTEWIPEASPTSTRLKAELHPSNYGSHVKNEYRDSKLTPEPVEMQHMRAIGAARDDFEADGGFVDDYVMGFFKVLSPANFNFKYFLNSCKNFNVLWSTKRSLLDFLSSVADLFPRYMGVFAKAQDTNHLIRELTRKETPFKRLATTAIKISSIKTLGGDENELRMAQAEFDIDYQSVLRYIREKNLPYDTPMINFLSKIADESATRSVSQEDGEPFVIRLCGESGTGKSTLTFPVLSAVSPDLSYDELKAKTYVRNPNSEFWDGCNVGKSFLVMDDYNQRRDEIDLAEMILVATRAEFLPPYSSNDRGDRKTMGVKGDSPGFRAVVLNSNTVEINPISLNSKEAINRRCHAMFYFSWADPKDTTVKQDWSHLKISRLNIKTYETEWVAEGREGIKRMQNEVNAGFKRHEVKKADLTENIKELMFVAHGGVECAAGAAVVMTYGVVALRYLDMAFSNTITFIAIMIVGHWLWGMVNYGNWLDKFLIGLCIIGMVFGALRLIGIFMDKLAEYNDRQEAKDWHNARLTWDKDITAESGEHRDKAFKAKIVVKNSGDQRLVAHNGELNLVAGNAVTMFIEYANTKIRFMNGLFIEGTACLFNRHLFYAADGTTSFVPAGTPMTVYSSNRSPQSTKFDPKRLYSIKEHDGTFRDLVIYHFPTEEAFQARPSILKHFWEGDRKVKGQKIVVAISSPSRVEYHYGDVAEDRIETRILFAEKAGYEKVHDIMEVSVPSKPGLCGSVAMLYNESLHNQILGVNVGTSRPGHMAVLFVTRAMLSKALEQIRIPNYKRRDMSDPHGGEQQVWRALTPEEKDERKITGEILCLYKSTYMAVPSLKTKIRPSPIHDMVVTHTTKPCNLSGGRDKLLENMNKYNEASLPFDSEMVRVAVDSIREELDAIRTVREYRKLTVEEAINGVPGVPYLTSMDLTTSPGYPFVGIGEKGEKRRFFIGEPPNLIPCKELREQIDLIERNISEYILPDFPFTNTLKDERKDNADVDNGKVRMFSMSSMALAIVMRMYFLPRVAHFYQCRHASFLTIGMDKTGREWDSFVRRMLEVGSTFQDADYKKFDTRANFVVRTHVNDLFLESWMSEDEIRSANTLLNYDAQAMHQVLDNIVVIPSGTSSGSMLTAIVGSLINETYIRCAWMTIMKGPSRDMYWYKSLVRTKNYGDDFVMTVHPDVESRFNCGEIAKFLATYNITMTSGDKTDVFVPKTVHEFTFLRNHTGRMMGRYVPLAWNPLEQINWIRVGEHAEEPEIACENNCNSALRALFFYGQKEFDKWRNEILRVRPKYNLLRYQPLWEEFMEIGSLTDVNGTFTFGQHTMLPKTVIDRSDDPVMDAMRYHAHKYFAVPNRIYPVYWNLKLLPMSVYETVAKGKVFNDDDFGLSNIAPVMNDLIYYSNLHFPESKKEMLAVSMGSVAQLWSEVRKHNLMNLIRLCDMVRCMTCDDYYDLDELGSSCITREPVLETSEYVIIDDGEDYNL